MRIWHPDLYPYLCRQHLLACWREGLGCLAILLHDKKGYHNHPQVKMYRGHLVTLYSTLCDLRAEMLRRGYKPRDILPTETEYNVLCSRVRTLYVKEWQTLEEQVEILKCKNCECYNNIMLKEKP